MIQDILLIVAKFTLSISMVVILYKTILYKLTFFGLIRWYFLIGIALSVFISCITLSVKLPEGHTSSMTQKIVNTVPAISTLVKIREAPVQNSVISFRQVLLIPGGSAFCILCPGC
jgi:hypothetical protein